MFCGNCGSSINENDKFCPNCGQAVVSDNNSNQNFTYNNTNNAYQANNQQVYSQPQRYQEEDVPSTGLNVLSFFFPIIGLVLFLVFMDKTPIKAKKIGKFALIGLLVEICLPVLFGACGLMYYW